MAICVNCGHEKGAGVFCGGCGQRTGGQQQAGNSPAFQQQIPPPQQQWSQPQQQPFQYQIPPQAPYGYYPPPRTNGMAIASFCCLFFCPILGIVFGHIALGQIKRSGERGSGLAIAGLVFCYGIIIFALIALAGSSSSGY